MSTLPLRALHIPRLRLMPSFTRVFAAFATVMDVFAEAQEMARAAHNRYPFAEG
jgi:hypothetical protein